MQIKDLIPWNRKESAAVPTARDEHPVVGLQREMNRVFDSFWNRFQQSFDGRIGLGTPRADVAETGEAVEVSVELPGLDAKDIEVSLTGDMLTIKGERKSEREEKHRGFYLSERSYGSFYRSIPVPPGVATDDAKAEFKKGVLTVSLPKTPEAQAKVKKIEVKGA